MVAQHLQNAGQTNVALTKLMLISCLNTVVLIHGFIVPAGLTVIPMIVAALVHCVIMLMLHFRI